MKGNQRRKDRRNKKGFTADDTRSIHRRLEFQIKVVRYAWYKINHPKQGTALQPASDI